MPISWERERAAEMVKNLYQHLFSRDPEADVLAGLTHYFAEGRLSCRIQLMRMMKSEEYFDKYVKEKSPQDVGRRLYIFVLAREPESQEVLMGAADQIARIGWRTQIDIMINSEEYLERFGDDTPPTAQLEQNVTDKVNVAVEPVPVGLSGRGERQSRLSQSVGLIRQGDRSRR